MLSRPPIFVALDVPDAQAALSLVERLAPTGVGFKIGMQLFYAAGMPLVHDIAARSPQAPVFVDLKLHDIPNTVGRAAESLLAHGVEFFNVHCLGGSAMMRAAAESTRRHQDATGSKATVIGVTILTSTAPETLQDELKITLSPNDAVAHLARLAQDSGLNGVVASAAEAAAIRQACGPDFRIVTPGIRPAGASVDDQSRIVTPAQALANGADWLVIGRPITAAPDPLAATKAILDEIAATVGAQ